MKEWVLNNTSVTEQEYDNIINSNTLKLKNSNLKEIYADYKLKKLSENPLGVINLFTLKKPSKFRCIVYRVKKEKNYFIYKDIKFSVLALNVENERYKKELYSEKRVGTCFDKSFDFCNSIDNSKIILAMCINPFFTTGKKFLHAFVEILGKDGKEYILDGTLNIKMEKDMYLKLLNAKIISEMSRNEFFEYVKFIEENNLGSLITVPEFLTFPKQINEGVKKYLKEKKG